MAFHVPNKYRIRDGRLGSDDSIGNAGAFAIPNKGKVFFVIASDGCGWEHVSVHIDGSKKTPNWSEMCFIKDLFWDEEDCVVQYHPAKSQYVNTHPGVLHLWRPIKEKLPTPPIFMV